MWNATNRVAWMQVSRDFPGLWGPQEGEVSPAAPGAWGRLVPQAHRVVTDGRDAPDPQEPRALEGPQDGQENQVGWAPTATALTVFPSLLLSSVHSYIHFSICLYTFIDMPIYYK